MEARMTRKFTQLVAVAALFGGLTSTEVLAGQTASSSPVPHCEKMTIDCWQKDDDDRVNEPERWQMHERNE
jgi:hypothetical protein